MEITTINGETRTVRNEAIDWWKNLCDDADSVEITLTSGECIVVAREAWGPIEAELLHLHKSEPIAA